MLCSTICSLSLETPPESTISLFALFSPSFLNIPIRCRVRPDPCCSIVLLRIRGTTAGSAGAQSSSFLPLSSCSENSVSAGHQRFYAAHGTKNRYDAPTTRRHYQPVDFGNAWPGEPCLDHACLGIWVMGGRALFALRQVRFRTLSRIPRKIPLGSSQGVYSVGAHEIGQRMLEVQTPLSEMISNVVREPAMPSIEHAFSNTGSTLPIVMCLCIRFP